MSRFEQDLNGLWGPFWQRNAIKKIEKMQNSADSGEICLDENGGAYWLSSKRYLPSDCAEILSHTDFKFSLEATTQAREAQDAEFIRSYHHETTEEELAEMRNVFGAGNTVIDVISGEVIEL